MSFQPQYSSATNRMTSLPGFTPSYDANGNVLNDGAHAYTWDVDGRYVSVDGSSIVYDALGRMVELSGGGSQKFYLPDGSQVLFQGQVARRAGLKLPGGTRVNYDSNSGGLLDYAHADHLGSFRLFTTPTRAFSSSQAYAPFGEPYAVSSISADQGFTGQNSNFALDLYVFPARQYSDQGRWTSPDPAGLSAVDPTNPQSWNRYAYVLNNPLAMVDPTGLCGDPYQDPAGQDCNGQFPGSGANNGNINDCTTASCTIYVYGSPGQGDVQNSGQCYEIFLDGADTGKNTCGNPGGGGSGGGGRGGIISWLINAAPHINSYARCVAQLSNAGSAQNALRLPTTGVSGFVAGAFTGNVWAGAIEDGLNLSGKNLGGELGSAGTMAAAEAGAGRLANKVLTVAVAGSTTIATPTSLSTISGTASVTVPGSVAGRLVGLASGVLTGRLILDTAVTFISGYACAADGYY